MSTAVCRRCLFSHCGRLSIKCVVKSPQMRHGRSRRIFIDGTRCHAFSIACRVRSLARSKYCKRSCKLFISYKAATAWSRVSIGNSLVRLTNSSIRFSLVFRISLDIGLTWLLPYSTVPAGCQGLFLPLTAGT